MTWKSFIWTTVLIRVLGQLVWEIDPYSHLDLEESLYGMIIVTSVWFVFEVARLATSVVAAVLALWLFKIIRRGRAFGHGAAIGVYLLAVLPVSAVHAMGWVVWECGDLQKLDYHGHTCLQRTLVFLK